MLENGREIQSTASYIQSFVFTTVARFTALLHKKTQSGIPLESVELVGIILLKRALCKYQASKSFVPG